MSAYNHDCHELGHEFYEVKPGVFRCTWCGKEYDEYE